MTFKAKECLECGASFAPTSGAQQYCVDGGCKKARTQQRWKKWYDKQPRHKLNEYQQAYRGRTGSDRMYELKSKYGITLDQWASMVSYAGGRCEICGKAEESLCVDHDHITGAVRGVLCRNCNRSIGQLGDTAESLQRAADYLAKAGMGRNVPRDSKDLGIQEHLF